MAVGNEQLSISRVIPGISYVPSLFHINLSLLQLFLFLQSGTCLYGPFLGLPLPSDERASGFAAISKE